MKNMSRTRFCRTAILLQPEHCRPRRSYPLPVVHS
jgi:hypothetical protein